MALNQIADVLWEVDRTEAELEADLVAGQVGSIASDTGTYVQKLNDNTVVKILAGHAAIVTYVNDWPEFKAALKAKPELIVATVDISVPSQNAPTPEAQFYVDQSDKIFIGNLLFDATGSTITKQYFYGSNVTPRVVRHHGMMKVVGDIAAYGQATLMSFYDSTEGQLDWYADQMLCTESDPQGDAKLHINTITADGSQFTTTKQSAIWQESWSDVHVESHRYGVIPQDAATQSEVNTAIQRQLDNGTFVFDTPQSSTNMSGTFYMGGYDYNFNGMDSPLAPNTQTGYLTLTNVTLNNDRSTGYYPGSLTFKHPVEVVGILSCKWSGPEAKFTHEFKCSGLTLTGQVIYVRHLSGDTLTLDNSTIIYETIDPALVITPVNGGVAVVSSWLSELQAVDLNPDLSGFPAQLNGRMFFNTFDKSIQVMTDNPNYWTLVGQSDFIRVINKTGAPIVRGQNLDARGVGVSGSNLALEAYDITALSAANSDDKGWAIVVATEDIAVDESGISAFGGTLLNVPTTGLIPGKPMYIGATGEWTNVRPSGSAKYVLMGTCIVSHATEGVVGLRVTQDDYDVEFDGCVLERHAYSIVEGAGILPVDDVVGQMYCDVWNMERTDENLPFQLGGTTHQLDTLTGNGPNGVARVLLNQGTTTTSQLNRMYLEVVADVPTLSVSTTYPTVPWAPVGRCSIWTAAKHAIDGPKMNRRTTSAKVVNSMGIIKAILERLGQLPPDVEEGCGPTASITANVMNMVSAPGSIYQTFLQEWTGLEVITDGIYLANGPGGAGLTNNEKYLDLKDLCGWTSKDEVRNTACTGNLVINGSINKEPAGLKLWAALPSTLDSTNTAGGLRTYEDSDNSANYSGDSDSKIVDFAICRIPYRLTSGGNTVEFLAPDGTATTDGQYIINRIDEPMGSSGGSGGGGGGLQNLLQVLLQGNSGDGALQIKNIADGDEGSQDAATVAQVGSWEDVSSGFFTGASGVTVDGTSQAFYNAAIKTVRFLFKFTASGVSAIELADIPAAYRPNTDYFEVGQSAETTAGTMVATYVFDGADSIRTYVVGIPDGTYRFSCDYII